MIVVGNISINSFFFMASLLSLLVNNYTSMSLKRVYVALSSSVTLESMRSLRRVVVYIEARGVVDI